MQIIIHGAGREVGRSCIELRADGMRILLDAGIKLLHHAIDYPTTIEHIEDLDLIMLTHAHLDHIGMLPMFFVKGMHSEIVCTPMTKALTKIMLEDSYKIEKARTLHPAYNIEDVNSILNKISAICYNTKTSRKNINFTFYNAGHIPGSASVLIEIGRKKLFYTGDINTSATRLHNPAVLPEKGADILIIESTYGDKNHPDRKHVETDFIDFVKFNAGRIPMLISCFAVGRAQELALILSEHDWEVPLYIDGMARKVTHAIYNYPKSVRDAAALRNAMDKIIEVKGHHQREEILKTNPIIITTSGMIEGGPIIDYIKLLKGKNFALALTGYQAEHTNGRKILEHKPITIDDNTFRLKCDFKHFDFSAHSGQKGLFSIIDRLKPKVLLIEHGDPEAVDAIYNYASDKGMTVYKPETGRTINLDE